MELKELLQKAYELNGSDIVIIPGAYVTCKVRGENRRASLSPRILPTYQL